MNFEQFVGRYQKRPVVEYENNVLQAIPNPLVTARVSTYNHISYIAECLEGMLMQKTSFPFEICIGEDESSDGTRELCIKYAQKYPEKIRLFLHSRENSVQINGRPTGRFQNRYTSYMGRGKYEAICEGDDYWIDPLKLQKQVNLLETNPGYAVCFHRTYRLFEATGERTVWKRTPRVIKPSYTLGDLLRSNFIPTPSIMLRNGLVPEFPAWFFSISAGDWLLLILHAQHGKIGFIDEAMSVYRVHDGGMYSGTTEARRLQMATELFEALRTNLGPKYQKQIGAGLSDYFLDMSAGCADRGEIAKAKAYLLKSITECPLNPDMRILDKLVLLTRLYLPSAYKTLKRCHTSHPHAKA